MANIAMGMAKLVLPIVVKEIKEAVKKGKEKKALKRAQKTGKGYHAAMTRALRRHKQAVSGSRMPSLSHAVDSGFSDSDEDEARGRGRGYADGDMCNDDAEMYAQRMRQIARQNEKERMRYAAYVASLEKQGSALPTFASGYRDDLEAHELNEFW
jgi:hypothetical protein